jgi:hypothetical protein
MRLLAVARIALVKPDKARGVENLVLQMAQRGQITEKVSLPFFLSRQGQAGAVLRHAAQQCAAVCAS